MKGRADRRVLTCPSDWHMPNPVLFRFSRAMGILECGIKSFDAAYPTARGADCSAQNSPSLMKRCSFQASGDHGPMSYQPRSLERPTVLVLGADGYLGWPMSLYLSARSYRVVAVDNFSKRRWEAEAGVAPLAPVPDMPSRLRLWEHIFGAAIEWRLVDLCDAGQVDALVADYCPDAIVHFGEQPSAPYSMIDVGHAAATQLNNVVGTLNVLFALRDRAPDCHLVKLGTMGEYGCPNVDIEEGWITVHQNGRSDRLPFPKLPNSFYHLSKVHDSHNIHFCCRAWGLRATDLNQGVVYGVQTEETALHPELRTSFHYDTVFGTVLNRFCTQAAIGMPITVYGKGGQTRGFIDIRDTMACIALALEHPPRHGEFRVFNQFTEQFTVNQLAELVRVARAGHGLEAKVIHLPNPRNEAEEHYYNAKHQLLSDLGLKPHLLSVTLVEQMIGWVEEHAHGLDPSALQDPSVTWSRGRTPLSTEVQR
jgi:UDP-sulfoquinovose synthase